MNRPSQSLDHTTQFRLRLLAALAATGLVTAAGATGCTGKGKSSEARTSGSHGPLVVPPTNGQGGGVAETPSESPAQLCGGPRFERTCYDDAGLRNIVGMPTGQIPQAPGAPWPGGPTEANGCPTADRVTNSCCNTPAGKPIREGDQCCYVYCEAPCCGRALTVAGVAITAASLERGDWSDGDTAGGAERDEALAADWLADALMEHASVASFARFTLELLALGAPAELVRDAQRAGLDEIRHAELCFALASRGAGKPLGPGPLPTPGSARTALTDIVRAAFREGCLGETVAALTACEQLRHCSDEQARQALVVIARDEADHAELGWRFIAWAMTQDPAGVREALRAEAVALASRPRPPVAANNEVALPGWRECGRLSVMERAAVHERAVEQVVMPCLRAALAATVEAVAA